MLADAWKNKETLWTNDTLLALCASTMVGLIGFLLKSKALRRTLVMRNLVKTKHMKLKSMSFLTFIRRPSILQEWENMVNYDDSPQPMMLIEGYQGTGKTILVQKFVEEQSKVRPTVYISLRDFNLEKWKEIIGKQIIFYPESFLLARGNIPIFNYFKLFFKKINMITRPCALKSLCRIYKLNDGFLLQWHPFQRNRDHY